VLFYDLTSTYFECDVPADETDSRRFGYSRDKRSDCVQVIVALVVTPEGPHWLTKCPCNTADKTTPGICSPSFKSVTVRPNASG
jgi:transposase